jgi:subtilisin family serine protease
MLRTTLGPIENGYATHPNVIAVAASTSLNKHAEYSNYGPQISVCAPSNNFPPLGDRGFAPGRGVWTIDNEGRGDDFTQNSLYTGIFGGTSSATPLVAGISALILSVNPELTAAEVKDILQATADKIVDTGMDLTGKNHGKYNSKGHSEWFGFGKVNAAKAVAEAKIRKNN